MKSMEEEEEKAEMVTLHDDVVLVRQSESESEPSVITVNCPDQIGLGCDLCRIILFFGLNIVRGDILTDGKWCYIVFWVTGNSKTRWAVLKKRLVEACPSCYSASGIAYNYSDLQPPKPPDVFLLKFCSYDRKGLLHDVTWMLCELELMIMKVKVSTTPDGKVMDLFFITDSRELLHTAKRQRDMCDQLKLVVGDEMISCEIEMLGPEVPTCLPMSSFLPSGFTEDNFDMEFHNHNKLSSGPLSSNDVSITLDNSLSPAHTLVQIVCQYQKGLLYDIMRTLKDYNIQISYGRFTTNQGRNCEVDLFIVQADGKKITEPSKQNALSNRLQMELFRPLRVAVASRGPDTELLVASPVELSGKGRPLVFFDITLALKLLDSGIFLAEIGRHVIRDREWEVYRILLDEGENSSNSRIKIQEQVWKVLMG